MYFVSVLGKEFLTLEILLGNIAIKLYISLLNFLRSLTMYFVSDVKVKSIPSKVAMRTCMYL